MAREKPRARTAARPARRGSQAKRETGPEPADRAKRGARAKRVGGQTKRAARTKPATRAKRDAPVNPAGQKKAPGRPGSGPRGARPKTAKDATAGRRRPDLLGPPPAEAVLRRDDRERQMAERLRKHTATSPKLSGGDVDADWQRAASAGEEAVGGTVATPDQDVVDELGEAVGVPRAPDEAFRTSQEILEARDHRRAQQEG